MADLTQEGSQVIGVEMYVIVACGFRGHMHCAQTHRVRHFEIAHLVFEHGGVFVGQTVLAKDAVKGTLFGFGNVICVFDPIDRIEHPIKPTGRQHLFNRDWLTVLRIGIEDCVGPVLGGKK